jgi:phospholipase C
MLAGGLAGATTLGLAKVGHVRRTGGDTIRRALETKADGSDLGAVEHVVFLMQENRSFDHYFGTMAGVTGYDDANNRGAFTQAWPGGEQSTLLPFHMNTKKQQAECTYDLSHSWPAEHASWDNGAMDAFVSTHTSSDYEGDLGVNTMGYYKKADIPFYYDLAKKFTICDNYFCSILGPTHPNRLMAISASLDPAGTNGGPIIVTNSSLSEYQGTCTWETMPDVLLDAPTPITWKCYNPYGSNYQPGASGFISKNMLLYFDQYANADTSSPQYTNAFSYYGTNVSGGLTGGTGPNDFQADVTANTLPQVSWIISPDTYDEHPPAPAALGEWYTQQVLDTLLSNPEVWASTVLFIMYDENDGFFDHVPPPTPMAGTADEYLTVSPLPSAAGGVAGPLGLGVRVPMIVVSPFSAGGHIVSEVFDHTSQLQFLEQLFGVTAPNLSSWRRSVTGDLTSTLTSLDKPVTKTPNLPLTSDSTSVPPVGPLSTAPSPIPDGTCNNTELIELSTSQTPFAIPKHQKIPTQSK